MSDDESSHSEAESEPEVPKKVEPPKKRQEPKRQQNSSGLDESAKELLEFNRQEREKMEDEIDELRRRSEKRKKQREIEEKRLTAERAAEDERRKAAEEAKRRQKIEDEEKKQKDRARKMAEFEKWKQPQKRNFVITRKADGDEEDEEDKENEEKSDAEKSKKTKEQLEAEKKAILRQRIKPLDIDGLDQAKLAEKAKEFHSWLARLEGERYDLEKRFKSQQAALVDLAERARQANKVGKGGLKRIGGADDSVDKIQAKYAGAPAKVEMFSKYERQKDKRSYDDKYQIFTGPQFISPVDRIKPQKILHWDEERMPIYGAGAE
ncbi:hypothetical protein HELRODRAFT_185295 [Helobdella robusta]|uniref:Troponin T n=1 Tax=Helobdella robusta TaxID=6412 RepID=T1FMM5_HELRO|nr:hypothetical protein HELRODRAFT_185295 [Helobdella robusta]ESO10978.1 hypothetical protein HELRODRAFT_185295 [Helobdella robusta]